MYAETICIHLLLSNEIPKENTRTTSEYYCHIIYIILSTYSKIIIILLIILILTINNINRKYLKSVGIDFIINYYSRHIIVEIIKTAFN